MNVHALACDYDGTVAENGRIMPATAQALARVRQSGRRLLLVTGRMLPDLRSVCPEADRMFDAIVAENGALVYYPERREVRPLGLAPEAAFIAALARRNVPYDVGTSIVATREPWAQACLEAIRETGVERTLVFNKGAVMLLPGGVTKWTGLEVALASLELSPHNVVAVGDAENDHAFLAMAECAVAVADAVPALKNRADLVTRGGAGAGVIELVEEHVLNDMGELFPRLTRHRLTLGTRSDGATVTITPHGTRLLVIGPSATGKSTLTGVLVEQLLGSRRTVLVIDPEGDYQTLAELEDIVVLGGRGEQALPSGDELDQLLRKPNMSLVLNLSAMTRAEKVEYASTVLGAAAAVRSRAGLPHWIVIDETHHVLPAEGSPATQLLRALGGALCMITLDVRELPPELPRFANVVASTDIEAFDAAVRAALDGRVGSLAAVAAAPLARGEAAIAEVGGTPTRFAVARRRVQHRRHVRKYTEGELPPERSFFFRGPDNALKLRAANLVRFVEIADGVDEATWAFHQERGEYSGWLRVMVKDPELADEVAVLEREGKAPAESRRRILDAIRRKYAV